jgi:DNA-binding CsgD family transcriptional regulator
MRRKEEIKTLCDTLTPREMEILRWVITGKRNKQIADALEIAEKTVKIHRSRVMGKTRVSSVAELVRLAAQANITPAE